MIYDYGSEGNRYPSGRQLKKVDKMKKYLLHFWNWQPQEDYLGLQLIRESNIHGVKYTAQPGRHIMERIFWILTIIVCTYAACQIGLATIMRLSINPIIISFLPSQTSISQIPFPAVTVCNVNRFKKSVFEVALEMAKNVSASETEESQLHGQTVLQALDHICDTKKSFSVKFNYSLNETTVNLKNRGIDLVPGNILQYTSEDPLNLLTQAFQSCEEMIPLCLWAGQPHKCSFVQIPTDFGMCCTWNLMPLELLLSSDTLLEESDDQIPNETLEGWKRFDHNYGILGPDETVDSKYDFPKHQSKAGQRSGLSFVINPNLEESFCSGHCARGFRIYPNSPIAWPHVSEFGMAVSPNSEMFMSLQAELTLAEDDIIDLDVSKRHCYFLGEYKLKVFKYYTLSNCVDECIGNMISDNCNCSRYDMPRKWDNNSVFCEGDGFACSERIKRKFNVDGTTKNCPLCLPSCDEVHYIAQTSSVPIYNNYYKWWKLSNYTHWEDAPWAGKDVSIIHIFFGSDTLYARIRKRLYRFNDLLASVGGILGLFLGFSFMSLAEPLYFTIRLCCSRLKGNQEGPSSADISTSRFSTDGKQFSNDVGDQYYNQIREYMGHQGRKSHPSLPFLN